LNLPTRFCFCQSPPLGWGRKERNPPIKQNPLFRLWPPWFNPVDPAGYGKQRFPPCPGPKNETQTSGPVSVPPPRDPPPAPPLATCGGPFFPSKAEPLFPDAGSEPIGLVPCRPARPGRPAWRPVERSRATARKKPAGEIILFLGWHPAGSLFFSVVVNSNPWGGHHVNQRPRRVHPLGPPPPTGGQSVKNIPGGLAKAAALDPGGRPGQSAVRPTGPAPGIGVPGPPGRWARPRTALESGKTRPLRKKEFSPPPAPTASPAHRIGKKKKIFRLKNPFPPLGGGRGR